MYLLIVFASSVLWFGKICRDGSRDCEVLSHVFLAAQFIRRYIHVNLASIIRSRQINNLRLLLFGASTANENQHPLWLVRRKSRSSSRSEVASTPCTQLAAPSRTTLDVRRCTRRSKRRACVMGLRRRC